MSRKKCSTRRRGRRKVVLQKPGGTLHARVQDVGPEHFGIVCVDCAKSRSKWMMSDFYGNVLVEPTTVEHERGALDAAICQVRQTAEARQIHDLVVAIERTGNYHLPIRRAFDTAPWRDGKFDTRIVHPFATKQHRVAANPGVKTDDNDLAAMFRATVAGYGLVEETLDPLSWKIRLLSRHRRDLVQKRSALCCQIREHLDAVLPGYAALFGDKLWESGIAFELANHVSSPRQFLDEGVLGLHRILRAAGVRHFQRSLERIVAWAGAAAAPDANATIQHRIFRTLEEDRRAKTRKTLELEADLASLLAHSDYVLLLSCPGINVVSAAELAGELGPMCNYAKANRITGRAGLYRSRYQSDEVDRQDGPLVRLCNRRLRTVLMMIADNLCKCNVYYRGLAALWKSKGQDPRYIRTKIATRFSRLVYQLVAGRQVLHHPGMKGRDYILDKLIRFHLGRHTPMTDVLADLQRAIDRIPTQARREESIPLQEELAKSLASRRGVKPIGEILPAVLARLGVSPLQTEDEAREPN